MVSLDEIIAWFEVDDARSRQYRAERLQFLLRHLDSNPMTEFCGGAMAAMAFDEARRALVHGLFVACTVLSQVCLEHTLAGLLRAAGRDDLDRATYDVLLREGQNEGYLLCRRVRDLRQTADNPESLRPLAEAAQRELTSLPSDTSGPRAR